MEYKQTPRQEGKLPLAVRSNGELAHGRPSVRDMQSEEIISNALAVSAVLFAVAAIAGEALLVAMGVLS